MVFVDRPTPELGTNLVLCFSLGYILPKGSRADELLENLKIRARLAHSDRNFNLV